MFQLTAPMTPTPGRAVSIGVAGGGVGAGGGKGAIPLPDFMTFATPGALVGAPGNARQDPAGGGDGMPGGILIAPPAGQPAAMEATESVLPEMTLVASTAPAFVGEGKATAAVDLHATRQTKIKAATTCPAVAEDIAVVAETPSPPMRPSAGKRPKASKEDALPDTTLPPIAAAAPAAPAAPVAAVAVPSIPTVTLPATLTSAPTVVQEASAPIQIMRAAAPDPVAASQGDTGPVIMRGAPGDPAPANTSPSVAVADSAVVSIGDIGAVRAAALVTPSNQPKPAITLATDASTSIAVAISDAASIGDVGAASIVAQGPPAYQPKPVTTLAASLGPIARMLSAAPSGVDRTIGSAPVQPGPTTVAVSAAPAASLPAMPASVASFLASVGSRPVAVPLTVTVSKPTPRATVSITSTTVAPAPTPAPTPASTGPAGRLFADAIHAAAGQGERSSRADIAPEPAALISAAASQPVTTASVTDRAPINMTQAHWPTKMIERIEYLRDAADAQDTRIKLIPDALGAIDVSMKRDGDTVRVHLAAERPDTRAIIADAQPRLAELGEQRGLKIAASSGQGFGQTGAQDFHQPRGNPAPQQPARPASARTGDPTTQDDDGDQRLA